MLNNEIKEKIQKDKKVIFVSEIEHNENTKGIICTERPLYREGIREEK